ncbi:hypothetical protein [Moorena producens]|uniref:hypothetical protein n=1 Tax=Moorena producens TaxID=1155739 RepID=UPI003C78449A
MSAGLPLVVMVVLKLSTSEKMGASLKVAAVAIYAVPKLIKIALQRRREYFIREEEKLINFFGFITKIMLPKTP